VIGNGEGKRGFYKKEGGSMNVNSENGYHRKMSISAETIAAFLITASRGIHAISVM